MAFNDNPRIVKLTKFFTDNMSDKNMQRVGKIGSFLDAKISKAFRTGVEHVEHNDMGKGSYLPTNEIKVLRSGQEGRVSAGRINILNSLLSRFTNIK